MNKYTIGLLVKNRYGVLGRISSMFSRRGFNIDSLTVGETADKSISRMTITMTGNSHDRDQLVKQLAKLHDRHALNCSYRFQQVSAPPKGTHGFVTA